MGSFGKCPKCPTGSRDVLLTAGLCLAHFKNSDDIIPRIDAPSKLKELAKNKKTLKSWFDEQIKQIPEKCENCNSKITIPTGMSNRTPVAHIVPKSSIKSVQTHSLNRWFGCWQCHSDYDNHSVAKVAQMPVVKLCRERYRQFEHLIPDSEKRHIPEYLKQ